jgi:hypothetical protein
MSLPFLGRQRPLPIRHLPLLSKVPSSISASPSSLRIRLLYDPEEIIVLFVFLSERLRGEAVLLCPMRSAVVVGHDLRERVEDFLVGHRFAVRSAMARLSRRRTKEGKILTCTERYRYKSSDARNKAKARYHPAR